jgi:hypothetical protein
MSKNNYLEKISSFFVLDIETLGPNTTPRNCGMFELACIHVQKNANGNWPEINQSTPSEIPLLHWQGQVSDRLVDQNTFQFHERIRGIDIMRHTRSPKREDRNDYAKLSAGLTEFFMHHKRSDSKLVMRRPQFDMPRVELLLEPHGFQWPVPYYAVQDLASLSEAVPFDTYPNNDSIGTPHYAIDDCLIEAAHYINVLEALNQAVYPKSDNLKIVK